MRLFRTTLLVLTCLAITAPAYAAMDYYTWGGFDAVVPALTNIGNMFGNSDYHSAFTAFAIFGSLLGAMSVYFGNLSGRGTNPHLWMIQIGIGTLIYTGFFVKTDTLYVYDPVLNQNQAIGGLPEGFVFAAGSINLIERFIVQSFDTSASLPPTTACGPMAQLNYQDQGGAIGLSTLQSSLSQIITDSSATQTVVRYVDDCVTFEIVRPGTTLTINELLDPGCGTTSFLDTLGWAANPANYTVSYLEGQTQGTTVTCQQAMNDIRSYYTNATNTNQAVQSACGSNNIADAAQCQQILATMITGSLGISMDPGTFIAMNSLSAYTNQTLLNAGTSFASGTLTEINQNQSGQAGGWTSGIMNPLMIDSFVAYSFMVFPVIALFVVTPLWRQAVTLIISMLIWNALLRVLDVVTFHMWVTQYQNSLAKALNNSGMGIAAQMGLPLKANKYLGQFAQMRSYVFMLATVISGALFKFGDSTLSRMASDAKLQNARMEKDLGDPDDRGKHAMENATNSARTIAMTQALKDGPYGASNMLGQGMVANEFANAAAGLGKLDNVGGDMRSMVQQQRNMSGVETANKAGYADNVSPAQAAEMGRVQAAQATETLKGLGMYGNSPEAQARQNAMSEVMQKSAQGMSIQAQAEDLSRKTGMSVPDSFKAIAATNIAQSGATAEYWAQHGGVDALTQFYKENTGYQTGRTQSTIDRVKAAHPGSLEAQQSIRQAINQADPSRNAQAVEADFRKDVAAGNFKAISGDRAESAAFMEMTGMDAAQLAHMSPERQQEAAKWAQERMVAAYGADATQAGTTVGGAEGTNLLRMIGETGAFRTAAQAVAEQSPDLRNNDLYFHDGHVTEAGILKAAQDAGLARPQSFGDLGKDEKAMGGLRKAVTLDGYGAMTGTTLEGRTASAYHMDQLATYLDAHNLHKSAAGVRRMEKLGDGFDFTLSTDAGGHVTGFQATAGGHTLFQDRAEENTMNSRRSGLSVEAGTFITTGYRQDEFNQHAQHGAYMMKVDGKDMMVQGNLYRDRAGNLIGGTIENGLNESVLAYRQDKDGNLHYANVTGKADTNGKLVAGKASEITEQEFVQKTQHGLAVVDSRGTAGMQNVDVHGSGGVKMDQSSTDTFGTRVESKQNLAGTLAQLNGFGQDGKLDPGAAATTVAIGQGALHETKGIVDDVSTFSKALRDPNTVIGGESKRERAAAAREAGREETRAAAETARTQQARVQQTNQKTARTLQNQSRTSQVPHGRTMPRPATSSVRPGIGKPNIKPGSGKPTPKP